MKRKIYLITFLSLFTMSSMIHSMDFVKAKFQALKSFISPTYNPQPGNKACNSVARMLEKIKQTPIHPSLVKEHEELIGDLEKSAGICNNRAQAIAVYEENPKRKIKNFLIEGDRLLIPVLQADKDIYRAFKKLNQSMEGQQIVRATAVANPTFDVQPGNKACLSFGRMLEKARKMSVDARLKHDQEDMMCSLAQGVKVCQMRSELITALQKRPDKENEAMVMEGDFYLVMTHGEVKKYYKALKAHSALPKSPTSTAVTAAQTAKQTGK